jgi:repressor LexA
VKSLTARQQEVLNIIKAAIEHTGRPPTRAEIAQQLGFRSANAAEDHLQALAKKGALILDASTSRGIRLAAEHLEAAGTLSERFLDNLLQLPLVGRVAAGSPILAQEHVEANYPVDAALFSEKPDYLLKVRGMSMRDIGILDGDLLAVKKTENAWHGQIVVARLNDEVTVKRYFSQGGRIQLLPENPAFKPIPIEDEDHFSIEGLAVGLLRVGQLG